MRHLPVLFLIFSLPFCGHTQSPGTRYSDLEQLLESSQAEAHETVAALFEMAKLYRKKGFERYNPDTAYTYLREGQRHYRKLSKRDQKRVDRAGYEPRQMRDLRAALREEGLDFKLKEETSQAMVDYMEHYSRLPHQLEEKAMAAYLRMRYEELKVTMDYDSLKQFSLDYEQALKEYMPDLQADITEGVFQAYFSESDSSSFDDLIALLKDFPETAVRLDAPLSQALEQAPYITRAENLLRGVDFRFLPRTVRVIYLYHYYTGEWSDLLGFQNRYPFYTDSFNLQRALAVAQAAPDLSLGFTDDRKELYERYVELGAPTHKAYQALQQLIARPVEERDWEEALRDVRRYAGFFSKEDQRLNELQELIQAETEGLVPRSLGDTINSIYGEYAPVISADGQRVYFCRNIDGNEDIYFAERQNGYWAAPQPIEALNTKDSHEAPLAISPDGSVLLMYNGGIVNYTQRTADGWSAPRPFFGKEEQPDWQGMSCISSDGQVSILAARSMDCVGARNEDNIDLYLSYRQADGSWGPLVNLGTTLNTPFEDRSPYLHPDQRTLYFSSSGHGGFGELDVYMTKRIGDGWTEWSKPVNLGKEINGPGYDWGYRISTDGKMAYFSAYEPGWQEELYKIRVPERFQPVPVSTIEGKLQLEAPLPEGATIVVEDLESGEQVGVVTPDPKTGRFFITLPAGRLYSYTVQGEGLYPISSNIDLRETEERMEEMEEISVPTIAEAKRRGMALPIKNLFFDTDSDRIKPTSYPELNRLSALLQNYELQVEIAGHTDSQGGAGYNVELSEQRAQQVKRYLIEQGCSSSQIRAKGYGQTEPVADNRTAEGRAQNRRVEIRFVEETE